MKKIICALLALLIISPLCSAYAIDESRYVGTWIQESVSPEDNDGYSISIIRLTEDHHAYVFSQSFNAGTAGFTSKKAQTWYVEEDYIRIFLNENTKARAVILSNGNLGLEYTSGGFSQYISLKDSTPEYNVEFYSSSNDPIIGCWYCDWEMTDEISIPGYEDYTRLVMILSFEDSGSIIRSEIDFKGNIAEMSAPATVGKWKYVDKNTYSLSILAIGVEEAYIVGDILYAMAAEKGLYFGYHRMIPLNYYTQLYRK